MRSDRPLNKIFPVLILLLYHFKKLLLKIQNRQVGKKAHEIDQLLSETGYEKFIEILKGKFGTHRQVIETYFETLLKGAS